MHGLSQLSGWFFAFRVPFLDKRASQCDVSGYFSPLKIAAGGDGTEVTESDEPLPT